MIIIYTRDTCVICNRVKKLLETYNISFSEKKIGIDVTTDYIKSTHPNHNLLPIIVTNEGVFSGNEAEKMITEYKEDFGKQLLHEVPNGEFGENFI